MRKDRLVVPETALETPAQVKPAQSAPWFKDAIIYQLHVRSFYDSNDDGVGDFRGLTQKLDYIQQLGVTAIWLLPFFPSPLKDDGYDIADYTNVNPMYGTLRDFRQFLREAHRRDLRVITELVMNHTSDQHEWFQRSRRAKPGSKWREFYVWSDRPDRYKEARIIFKDFEASNWSWDPVAEAYFWHRFYSHQPDLNFENPEVCEAMLKVVDFWFGLGVDGLRLDAVPYLFEREGTNCENLPETHQFLKRLRSYVDQRHLDKMLLAEANQWPEDAAAYFGDGDECHMNFNFPLMPRLFMGLQREDRFPIIDILEQTPPLPENCQWAIFLRNHDELTLEMVTDEERDYMYRVYAEDPQARVNLGIRRRLAPLLKNDRRKVELLNGLLLSLPGTPIVYYGDEIGMGDNIYLGDRNGVRTPMQWNADRNAGFSRANPQKLFLPLIIDSEYHYAACNVEVDHNSPHSLLWWTRRIISLRRQYTSFGHGTFEIVMPDNPKVLAFLREHEGETMLVVANLSRFVQAAQLDLSRYRGQTPIETFGSTPFPPIGELPYFFTLGPYAFYWFKLEWQDPHAAEMVQEDLPFCQLEGDWQQLFQGKAKMALERALPKFLERHRWFGGKARTIRGASVTDAFPILQPHSAEPMYLLLVESRYADGDPETYLMPVVFAEDERANNIMGDHPGAGILQLQQNNKGEQRILCDATWEEEFWTPVLESLARRRSIRGRRGDLVGQQNAKVYKQISRGDVKDLELHVHGGQQSNTSVIYGDRFILKIFRRLRSGINPDLEIGRFLTEKVPLEHVPAVAGALEYQQPDAEPMTVAILQQYRANEGDAWVYTLEELGRYVEQVQSGVDRELARHSAPSGTILDVARQPTPDWARELIGPYLGSAGLLGQRTAELHLALAREVDDPEFVPESFTKLYQRSLYQSMRSHARRALQLLRRQIHTLPEELKPDAERLATREDDILKHYQNLLEQKIEALRIRCHGDYHLGQVLYTGKDFVIIDFEGEPERPLSERRIKTSPLRDVAGMMRSFHYAAHAAALGQAPGLMMHVEDGESLGPWLDIWYCYSAAAFLQSYLNTAAQGNVLPADDRQLEILLHAHVMEKAVYELVYELNNRPDWVNIPLEAIRRLLDS